MATKNPTFEQHGGDERVEEHKSERQTRHFGLECATTWGEARSQAACRRELTGALAAQVYARAALTHSLAQGMYTAEGSACALAGAFFMRRRPTPRHATPPLLRYSPDLRPLSCENV
jgi:hypothetical protein